MFKGLRFPEPLKRIALDIFDQVIDGGEDFFVLFLPLKSKRAFYCTGCARGWPRRRVTPGPSGIIGTA